MDARVQQAREHHRQAAESERLAGMHREQRDRMIRQLRAEEPGRWSYPKLAKAVGCSPQLIAYIIQGRRGPRGTEPSTAPGGSAHRATRPGDSQ